MSIVVRILTCFAILVMSIMSANADILKAPEGKVILTITGNIKHTNAPGEARFDREMLEALGMVSIDTETYWTDGVQKFEGVPGKLLMEAVGVTEGKLQIHALDKYKAKVPVEDLIKHRATIMLKNMGEYLTVAKKGPLWLIYPIDDEQKLLKKQINSRSVWQIQTIEVL
ncbi:oxidoreductase [Leucothrix pacifica]|nr:oxidoreductase [Leucothrix pacifica]